LKARLILAYSGNALQLFVLIPAVVPNQYHFGATLAGNRPTEGFLIVNSMPSKKFLSSRKFTSWDQIRLRDHRSGMLKRWSQQHAVFDERGHISRSPETGKDRQNR
jgi:hypothetical protein